MTASITCPQCGLTSYHPRDIENGYCSNCHQFNGDVLRFRLALLGYPVEDEAIDGAADRAAQELWGEPE